jgi:hypothetical protein
MSAPKIIRVFQDVNMQNGHLGLNRLARKHNVAVDTKDRGEFIIFINKKQTMVKAMHAGGLLLFYKSPSGRITMGAIQNIPQAFNSDEHFWMEKAIQTALERKLNV